MSSHVLVPSKKLGSLEKQVQDLTERLQVEVGEKKRLVEVNDELYSAAVEAFGKSLR